MVLFKKEILVIKCVLILNNSVVWTTDNMDKLDSICDESDNSEIKSNGYNVQTSYFDDLSNWDFFKVTRFGSIVLFDGVGRLVNADDLICIIFRKNGALENIETKLYGSSTSVYTFIPSGKKYGLAP